MTVPRFAAIAAVLLLAPALAFAAAKPAAKKQPPPVPFTSAESVMAWIGGYRAKPEPHRLAEGVRAMIASGVFADLDQAGVYIGFIAGVLGDNPGQARTLIGAMFPMQPEHQVVVVKAIAFSGLAEWKEIMTQAAERMPARKVLIEKYLYKNAPTLETLPLDSGAFAMDANWGYFFATGSSDPIDRVIGALAWSTDKNNLERLTLGNMAKWTLASNAQRSPDILAMLKARAPLYKGATAVALKDVIDATEEYDVGRIRKQAVAAVEELKTKGPENSRNAAWWGQAGTTTLALGCVVASALGQVQIGIPCVLGGALGTAATKYFSSP